MSLSRAQTATDQTPSKPKHRRYADGPLKLQEFRRSPAGSVPGRALTMTRVMFSYEFEVQQLNDNRFMASLVSLNTFSVFLPEESWWNHADSEKLLDHEQGHFDLAEIAARRVQLAFDKLFQANKSITAKGRSAKSAVRALDQKLEKVMKIANDQAVEENALYDLQTRHGAHHSSQAEQRRIHLLTLARLKKDLAKKPRRAARVGPAAQGRAQPIHDAS